MSDTTEKTTGSAAQTAAPAAQAAAPATPPEGRGPGWARRFFGVVAQRRTWLNVVYLMLAFPLGLLYFVFLVAGASIGFALAILWVGIPILLIVAAAWWAFAALERTLARLLLGVDCGLNPHPWENETGALSRLRAHLTHSSTWRSLAFVLLKFPMGVASFALTVALGGITQAMLFAPLWAMSAKTNGGHFALWGIDSPWAAALLIPAGLLVMFVGLHLLNGLAALWRLLVEALLVEPADAGPRASAGGGLPHPPADPYDPHAVAVTGTPGVAAPPALPAPPQPAPAPSAEEASQ